MEISNYINRSIRKKRLKIGMPKQINLVDKFKGKKRQIFGASIMALANVALYSSFLDLSFKTKTAVAVIGCGTGLALYISGERKLKKDRQMLNNSNKIDNEKDNQKE